MKPFFVVNYRKTLVKIWDEFILWSRRGQTAFSDVRYNFDLLLSPLSSPDLSPPSLSSTGSRVKYPSPNSKLGQVSTYTLYSVIFAICLFFDSKSKRMVSEI